MKIVKSFTFWFVILGIVGIVLNLIGADDIRLFIGLNPILNVLSSSATCCDYINTIPYYDLPNKYVVDLYAASNNLYDNTDYSGISNFKSRL